MRKLASIRKIDSIESIPDADAICLAHVDGWQTVVKIDEFKPGDLCVYFEIDSFIPITPAISHLVKRSRRVIGGREGIRVKSVNLRQVLSQGLAIPVTSYFHENCPPEGTDVSELLGVCKYERDEIVDESSTNFPHFLRRTDQERCQNAVKNIFIYNQNSEFEVTLKLIGSSFTSFYNNGTTGVCSRRVWFDPKLDNFDSSYFVQMFKDSKLDEVLHKYGKNIAIQGELVGPGVESNAELLENRQLYIFDIFDIDYRVCYPPVERYRILHELYSLGLDNALVKHVPIFYKSAKLGDLGIRDNKDLLKFAEGPGIKRKNREGLVFKRVDGKFSFKAISNKYLLGE